MKIAYFGTPDLSAQFLEQLINDKSLDIEVSLVVTQPDKPVGRSGLIQPSPVKVIAQRHNIYVIDSLPLVEPLRELDLAIMYFYGNIIPGDLLAAPRFGFWNIHFSLLPRYRGTSPATYSLIMGDKETAVSLLVADEKLDHGPIIRQEKIAIKPSESRISLETRLHRLGYQLVTDEIVAVNSDAEKWREKLTEQDHYQKTYTRFPVREDGFIPLQTLKDALAGKNTEFVPKIVRDFAARNEVAIPERTLKKSISDLYRGLHPYPGIWTKVMINGTEKRLKILELNLENFAILQVQLEGKTAVPFTNSALSSETR